MSVVLSRHCYKRCRRFRRRDVRHRYRNRSLKVSAARTLFPLRNALPRTLPHHEAPLIRLIGQTSLPTIIPSRLRCTHNLFFFFIIFLKLLNNSVVLIPRPQDLRLILLHQLLLHFYLVFHVRNLHIICFGLIAPFTDLTEVLLIGQLIPHVQSLNRKLHFLNAIVITIKSLMLDVFLIRFDVFLMGLHLIGFSLQCI